MKTDFELLDRLLRIPSVSGDIPHVNEAVDFLRDYLVGKGVECAVETMEDGRKILYATTLPGCKTPDYLFNAHLDVVPADDPAMFVPVVKDGRVIAEGYHRKCGDFHAERNALLNCTEDPAGADLYVTLEPCCHHGRTPPCTDIILEKGIRRVFVGALDVNPKVAGQGVQILRDLGACKLRLLTNNPKKISGLDAFGLEILERVPIEIEAQKYDRKYLLTKQQRMHHMTHYGEEQ